MRKKLVILGAGPTGLCAADILQAKFDVTLIEKANFLGGLAASFEMEGQLIPKYYHHIVSHNHFTVNYLKRFNGLKDNEWKKVKVAVAVNKKFYITNNIKGLIDFFLRYKELSLWAKFRLMLFGAYTIFLMKPNKIKDEKDAKSWLYTLAGKEVTDKFFYHLYGRNKFNIGLEYISAKQFAHRLDEREIYDQFTFPREKEGIQLLIDGLEKIITEKGVKILRNFTTKNIDVKKKEIIGNKKIKYDILINTIPVPEFLKIAKELPEDYEEKLKKLRYCPCVGLVFGTEDYLQKGVYWTNLFNERIHVIMQHSVLVDKYNSKINWCIRYGGSEEDLYKSDEEIKELYLDVIKKYYPNAKIKWVKVFRELYAEPVYDKDYINYKPDYLTPVKDLYMSGVQVTFPKIRNINTALESGINVSNIILSSRYLADGT